MSESATCGSCKWWDQTVPGSFPYNEHPCRRMGYDGYTGGKVFRESLASAFPMVKADAEVVTHRTFGCVMHEARDMHS